MTTAPAAAAEYVVTASTWERPVNPPRPRSRRAPAPDASPPATVTETSLTLHASPTCPAMAEEEVVWRGTRTSPAPPDAWPCAECIPAASLSPSGGLPDPAPSAPAPSPHTPADGPQTASSASPSSVTYDAGEVAAYLLTSPAKLTTDAITESLRAAALAYVEQYTGDLSFLVDLRHSLDRYGALTSAQARGALNVWRAELQRAERDRESTPPSSAPGDPTLNLSLLPAAGYGVPAADPSSPPALYRVAQRILKPDDPYPPPWKWSTVVTTGGGAHFVGGCLATSPSIYRGQHVENMRRIMADPAAAVALYAASVGACARCHRQLTDSTSRTRGLGPDCAAILGVS